MATYYVKNGGNDSLDGLSDGNAWATTTKVNSTSFSAGDNILFKRGDTWVVYDGIELVCDNAGTSGNRITYGAYGTGVKPVITARATIYGSNVSGNWVNLGSNVWRLAYGPFFIRRVWFNGIEQLMSPDNTPTVTATWYHDNSYLYVYATSNPSTAYTSMESPNVEHTGGNYSYGQIIVTANYVTIDNLDVSGGYESIMVQADYCSITNCTIGKHSGFWGINIYSGSDNGIITNCSIDTGCEQFYQYADAQQTNDAIHMENNVNGWSISANTFKNWAHAAICMYCLTSGHTMTNNLFYDNDVYAPDISYSKGFDISVVTGNTCTGNKIYNNYFHDIANENQLAAPNFEIYCNVIDSIVGMGYAYGYPGTGHGISLLGSSGLDSDVSGNKIYNNTIVNCRDAGIVIERYGEGIKQNNDITNNLLWNNDTDGNPDDNSKHYQLHMDYDVSTILHHTFRNNLLYHPNTDQDSVYYGRETDLVYGLRHFTVAEFNAYNGVIHNGIYDTITNNIWGDALFVDAPNGDYHLTVNSPAIGAGINVGITTDYDGVAFNATPSIGAYEYGTPPIPSLSITGSIHKFNVIHPYYVDVKYGYLYNWYAATDVRNIASNGWHVPTRSEFQTLESFLGSSTSGGKLKETGTVYWLTPNTGATNETNFNARGHGGRADAGSAYPGRFLAINETGKLWSVTPNDPSLAYILKLDYDLATSATNTMQYRYYANGIRLIKDSTTLSDGQSSTYIGNDGKIYRTICIGTQEWLADNLCETLYRNNDSIPEVTDGPTWVALTTGARCSYDNNESNAL